METLNILTYSTEYHRYLYKKITSEKCINIRIYKKYDIEILNNIYNYLKLYITILSVFIKINPRKNKINLYISKINSKYSNHLLTKFENKFNTINIIEDGAYTINNVNLINEYISTKFKHHRPVYHTVHNIKDIHNSNKIHLKINSNVDVLVDTCWVIGQKLYKNNKEFKLYLNSLEIFLKSRNWKMITFFPHPKEVIVQNPFNISTNINKRSSLVCFEEFMENQRFMPSHIVGFYSTTLYNVHEIYGDKISINALYNDKIDNIINATGIYEYYSNVGINVISQSL